ncbi:phage tail tube protein [Anaerovibrio sp.]|uniref:phage tail tube protein n=1 Tax=Anaerovibrio sp. TaxID=1872532 RepID=UPI0025C4E5FB|nr:phage tail tube protein [Anaerovibrio sp.]MBR2143774.1 phage tail tube protein [Anaerovibrio sp.]
MAIDAIRTMHAKDVVAAKMASAYVTIDGERFLLFQAKDLTARLEKDKQEVAILGRMSKGHKTVSVNGTGSMTIYKNTALFDRMLLKLKNTGEDTYFDIQITNEDPTSAAGRQTTILKDCNIDSAVIANFDADGEWLEQEIDFTFEDIEQPEQFAVLDGMKA